jgi:hypothetical protein
MRTANHRFFPLNFDTVAVVITAVVIAHKLNGVGSNGPITI